MIMAPGTGAQCGLIYESLTLKQDTFSGKGHVGFCVKKLQKCNSLFFFAENLVAGLLKKV